MISKPPRDKDDQVTPHNHPEILDSYHVIRRISAQWIVKDKDGNQRLSSMAFQPSSGKNGGMSVDIKQLIESDGIDPKKFVTTPRWMGSVILEISKIRSLGLLVGYDPLTTPEPNPYHGEVWGSFPKRVKRKLQEEFSEWFVEIKNVKLKN